MAFKSKLADVETSIFAVMTKMANDHGAVNLSQGFPDFPVDPDLIGLVNHYMKAGCNQYAPMPGVPELRRAVSEKTLATQGIKYNHDTEITVTAGATQALATAIAALVHPGDEIIVFEPVYDAYIPLVEVQGGRAVSVELKAPDFLPDWDEVRKAVSSKTKGIIINTPHNPCGSVIGKDDIDQLALIAKENDLYVISDEVYEHIVFDGNNHLSIGSHEELRNRSFVISSFGKTFHATGWKCGYCLASEELTKEFRKVHQFIVYSVNTPVQYAMADYLSDPQNYQNVSSMYQEKRDLVTSLLEESAFSFTPADGSYFQLIDYSKVHFGTGTDFAVQLVREKGVALIPLEPFYRDFKAPNYIRICFAKGNETLLDGLSRLIQ